MAEPFFRQIEMALASMTRGELGKVVRRVLASVRRSWTSSSSPSSSGVSMSQATVKWTSPSSSTW